MTTEIWEFPIRLIQLLKNVPSLVVFENHLFRRLSTLLAIQKIPIEERLRFLAAPHFSSSAFVNNCCRLIRSQVVI